MDVGAVAHAVWVVLLPVMLLVSLLRFLFVRGIRMGPLLALLLWSGAALWQGHGSGPGWFVPAAYGVLGLALLEILVVLVKVVRVRVVTPDGLRHLVAAAQESTGRVVMMLAVVPNGNLLVEEVPPGTGSRSVRLTEGCPLCFVEGVASELVGDGGPVVEEYRARLSHGVNQLLFLRRPAPGAPWEYRLDDAAGRHAVHRSPGCPQHGGRAF
ncbi:hypothetical protein [Kitasatospora sp. NPDC088346]|uniref:hypothetical protein n=1 Tax=Kitasatospora sp. NPDC088346 TaxID=3364073 RepID=UPI003804AC30